ncbi:hypothetical protein CK203_116417 [Vitis vinifera]|uniref:Uncharacterized protein n=1 Tax=Vitis vinifera TaxID=29760 RepID=A0A438CAS9_VITVI|nr:hypothetical protein CK203_116417 [Vitis vinifera]
MASLLAAPSFSPQLRIFQGLRTKAIKTLNSVQLPAIRCSLNSNQTLKTCKICKTQFDPLLNHPRACRFHTAHFGGTPFLLLLHCLGFMDEEELSGYVFYSVGDGRKTRIAVNREATELNVDAVQLLGVLDPMHYAYIMLLHDGYFNATSFQCSISPHLFSILHTSGETKRKFESVYTGGTMNTPDSGQVLQYWHCCGSEDPLILDALLPPHSSYDD